MCSQEVDAAYRRLRAHTTGELRFDEHLRKLKYVIAPSGRLVAPVMVAMLQSADAVLFVPECIEDSLEVQLTLEQFEERGDNGALTDRWRIYHGEPQDVNWAFIDIDAVRNGPAVIDGDALMQENPLAAEEPALCMMMNTEHRDDLRRMCLAYSRINIQYPVMVGIDPLGIDVRGRFDVTRVESEEQMPTAEDAKRILASMIEHAKAEANA